MTTSVFLSTTEPRHRDQAARRATVFSTARQQRAVSNHHGTSIRRQTSMETPLLADIGKPNRSMLQLTAD